MERRRQEAESLPFHECILAAARAVGRGASVLCALLGAVGLSGWISGIAVLKGALPGGTPAMRPNTAVALLAVGLSLFLAARGPMTRQTTAVARGAAGLAALIGGLTLLEYVTGTGLGIDQLLFRDDSVRLMTGAPGRVAPSVAAALTLAGAASLGLSMRRLPAWAGQISGLSVLGLGLLRLYGLAYHAPEMERFGAYMALPTALALVLAGIAAFLARPDEGLAGLLMKAGIMSPLGRRLVATNLIVPLLLGWAVLAGQDAGLYGGRLGTALLVWGHVTVFTVVVFVTLPVGRRVELAHARAEWQVRQNELLQAFMDHTPATVFITDLDGRFLAVNSRFEENTCLSYEQVLGRRAEDVLPVDLARHMSSDDFGTRVRDTAVQREERLLLPIGPRDVLTTLFPLTDPTDTPYAVCGVVIDVTERVAAQREVQRSHQRFRALLESAPDATLITDGDGSIVMANAQVQRLFGHRPDDLVGTNVADLVPGARRRRHSALLSAYLRRRDPQPIVLDRDLYGLHRDGVEFPVEVSVSTLQDEQEAVMFMAVRDITERRQSEAERAGRYEQQRRIAYTLQHSLMGEPPRLPHLSSAHRYLASVQDPGVGGDWFDIIPLDAHRTGIVIGDVMGRGLEAAAVMGQLRAASHALARTGIPPSRLMTGLDAFVGDLADQLVTCVYLVIDQEAHEVTLCSAGHMPVIARPPDGPAHRLPAPVGVPLGVNELSGAAVPFEETTQPLLPGSTVALYTDGLVERPGTDIEVQIDVLTRTLDGVLKDAPTDPDTLDATAAHLVGSLIPDTATHDDDVTLLLLGLPAPQQ
ncbi:SpoIIE family protein phosphatase [Streptomyces sp. Ru62]|uniref:SpoIIE family protein phosphatase n=1 Tax=Streptomyces sp. Ru62 TaxID=2080745 RepID=UPI0015E3F038|nr:SpoIIE family protein phosphatase [Streptomyces sp. Ru62]